MTELQLEEKNPQLQLEAEIYRWVYDHDDPNNLLVVYYAGHGVYDKALKVLEFSPYISQYKIQGRQLTAIPGLTMWTMTFVQPGTKLREP